MRSSLVKFAVLGGILFLAGSCSAAGLGTGQVLKETPRTISNYCVLDSLIYPSINDTAGTLDQIADHNLSFECGCLPKEHQPTECIP